MPPMGDPAMMGLMMGAGGDLGPGLMPSISGAIAALAVASP